MRKLFHWLGRLPKRERAVFVVFDTKGAGRMVGAFASARLAESVRAVDPHYYRVHRLQLDRVRSEALAWLNSPAQRDALAQLVPAEE